MSGQVRFPRGLAVRPYRSRLKALVLLDCADDEHWVAYLWKIQGSRENVARALPLPKSERMMVPMRCPLISKYRNPCDDGGRREGHGAEDEAERETGEYKLREMFGLQRAHLHGLSSISALIID